MRSQRSSEILRLKRLRAATQVAFQSAKNRLEKKMEAENRLHKELQDLDQARMEVLRAMSVVDGQSPGHIPCYSAWLLWAERQRAALNMAQAKASSEYEKQKTKRAFGRHRVTEKIGKRRN